MPVICSNKWRLFRSAKWRTACRKPISQGRADVVHLNASLARYLSSEMSTAVVPLSWASKMWGASPG